MPARVNRDLAADVLASSEPRSPGYSDYEVYRYYAIHPVSKFPLSVTLFPHGLLKCDAEYMLSRCGVQVRAMYGTRKTAVEYKFRRLRAHKNNLLVLRSHIGKCPYVMMSREFALAIRTYT
jgi:hypothetical protein